MKVLIVNTIYFENYHAQNENWDGKTAWWKRKGGSSYAVAILEGVYKMTSLDSIPHGFKPIDDCEIRDSLCQLETLDSTELVDVIEACKRTSDKCEYSDRVSLPNGIKDVTHLDTYRLG